MYTVSRKSSWLLFFMLLFSAGYGFAQQLTVNYRSIPNISFRSPVCIGKTNKGFAIIDIVSTDSSVLHFIDTNLQLIKTRMLPAAAYEANAFTKNNEVHFIWQQRSGDFTSIRLWQVKEEGEIHITERMEAAPGSRHVFQQMTSDKKNHYSFFYTFFAGPQQLVIKGILYDSSLQQVKKIDQSFEYDGNMQRLTQVLLDPKGNLHLVIYDKLTNYRLSAGIQVYTIPYDSENFITETYRFDKVKFYDLIFFDHPAAEQVQLTGFYYNGATKIKEGLATIGLPYERKLPFTQKFFPFTKEQRKELQQEMQHVRRKNDVMDFVKLKDIIEEDGQVFLTTWILDVPNYLLVKDNEREDPKNTDITKWMRPGKEGTFESRVQGLYPGRVITRSGSASSVSNMREVYSLQPGGNQFLSAAQQPIVQNPQAGKPGMAGLPPVDLKIKWVKPRKFAFFSLDTRQDSMWLQILPADFPISSASYQPWLWDYPMVENSRLSFIHKNQSAEIDTISPVPRQTNFNDISFVRIGSEGTLISSLFPQVTQEHLFSKPFRITAGKYLSFYRQTATAESGIAIIEMKK
ncbi:MAG: hypothetical protein HYU70_06905 [Bacteroidetes bacterium]|nr:hypothetical protein [Bacteroidota bacterium]